MLRYTSSVFKSIHNLLTKIIPGRTLYVAFDSGGRNKPTIVLLHGVAATSKAWDELVKKLDTNEYRVLALDMLGCGQSPSPKNCKYTVQDYVDSVHRTLKRLKIKRPFKIAGHSLGAIVAARYARLYPKDVSVEYLLSLPLYPKDEDFHTNSTRRYTDLFIKAYEFLMQNKDFTIGSARNLRKLLRVKDGIDINESNWEGFILALKNTIIDQDTYNDIKNSNQPVFVIYGGLDEFLVQDNMKRLAQLKNVQATKLLAVDHRIGNRFAREVARQIYAI